MISRVFVPWPISRIFLCYVNKRKHTFIRNCKKNRQNRLIRLSLALKRTSPDFEGIEGIRSQISEF